MDVDQNGNRVYRIVSYTNTFVKSHCTLQLLIIRQTTNSGWRNQALFASVGFTFEAISTFTMPIRLQ